MEARAHPHKLSYYKKVPYITGLYTCDICNGRTKDLYHCDICKNYDNCTDCFSNVQVNKKHPHPLTFFNSTRELRVYSSGFICNICDAEDKESGYHCWQCGLYDLCVNCYNKYEEEKNPKNELEAKINKLNEENQILKQKLANTNFNIIDNKQISSMNLEELSEYEEKLKLVKKSIAERKLVLQKNKESSECIVCFDKKRDIVFDCGHLCCCDDCSKQLKDCPMCKRVITQRIKVFVP